MVIDDREERRSALAGLVAGAGMQLAGESRHGIGCTQLLRACQPDLVLVAFDEPLARAVQTVEYAHAMLPAGVVIAYGPDPDVSTFQEATRAGASMLLDAGRMEEEFTRVLRALEYRAARVASGAPSLLRGLVLAVVGLKGGVGKTTIAVNVAAAIARERQRSVLLIDLDTRFGDVAIALDTAPRLTTAHAARDLPELDFQSFRQRLASHESGAWILGAPTGYGEWTAVGQEEIASLVGFAADFFDYVVLDTPSSGTEIETALAVADVALVVTSLDLPSARNTALLLDSLEADNRPDRRVLVVANHIAPEAPLDTGDVAAVVCHDALWEVPHDRQLRWASQTGRPLTTARPKAPSSLSLRALAGRIVQEPQRIDRRTAIRGESGEAGAAARERLVRHLVRMGVFRATPLLEEPTFVFRHGTGSSFHREDCRLGRRILAAHRVMVAASRLPAHLRPCRVCTPVAAAA
jgi:pilus assembly protein CpaE